MAPQVSTFPVEIAIKLADGRRIVLTRFSSFSIETSLMSDEYARYTLQAEGFDLDAYDQNGRKADHPDDMVRFIRMG